MCADLDAGKRAVVFGVAMILAFLHAAADAHIRFVVHNYSLLYCVVRMRTRLACRRSYAISIYGIVNNMPAFLTKNNFLHIL